MANRAFPCYNYYTKGKQNRLTKEKITMVNAGRTVIDFDKDWKFLKMTQADGRRELPIENFDFDDSVCENVNLPHTWNAVDGADGRGGVDEGGEHYYRGLGGYRKNYVFPSELGGKRIFMEFKGANTVAELYINGSFVGKHEGGYAAFRFDITNFVTLGEENLICVKVNNAPTDYIAPITDQGDFTKMGGIYRDVRLIAVPDLHIDLMDYGSSGVYITPENISNSSADIRALVKLRNDGTAKKSVNIVTEIFDADGRCVGKSDSKEIINPEKSIDYNTSIVIQNPHLWNGIHAPYLYTAKVTLFSDDGEILDEVTESFGVRTYHIDPDEGFFLNGEHYDLHGVNYHQDSFESGWAMTDEQRERDYKMMQDLGCTAVRMAHYQHDSYEYDLCDRLGLCVWTEIGIVNKMSDDDDNLSIADGFADNAKQQLRELIRQNYNHPSVIIWGISNELYQMSDEIFELYTELQAIAKSEDKSRLTSFADAQFWGRFMDLPGDVVGYNRYFGWYIDGADNAFGKWLDEYHKKEKRPIGVTEYGGGGAISQHKDSIVWAEDIDSWGPRHPENYQSALHEDIWRQFAQRPYLWGKFVWCMFDFASDGREEGDTKGLNDKGLCTRERVPKDAYYFYKSVWNDEPMVWLTEKRFAERPSAVPRVKAYSNAEKVGLYLDENFVGYGKKSCTVFIWENINLSADVKCEIRAVAEFSDGTILEDFAEWEGQDHEPA